MSPDESNVDLAMAAGLAAAMAGAKGPRYVEAPDGTRIVFLERSNTVDDENADATRIVFSGCFSIDGDTVLDRRGAPLKGGFEAMFDGPGDPVGAWTWLAETVDDNVRKKFEAVFDSTFSEDGLRMDIGPEAFLLFSDSSCWCAYEREKPDRSELLRCPSERTEFPRRWEIQGREGKAGAG